MKTNLMHYLSSDAKSENIFIIFVPTQRIRTTRGWEESDPKHTETRDILLKVWEGLQQKADANKDGQVRENVDWHRSFPNVQIKIFGSLR